MSGVLNRSHGRGDVERYRPLDSSTRALSSPPLKEAEHYKLEEAEYYFEQFIQEHGRHYASEQEKQERFEIFKQSLQKINEQNLQSRHAVFGITEFADVTKEEILTPYKSSKQDSKVSHIHCKTVTDVKVPDAPESFDWRDHNAVTRVKNQGQCKAWWAFAAIGNLEGQYAIKNKELLEFSEQQLVDCDLLSVGCYEGELIFPNRVLVGMGGAMTEKSYPYESGMNVGCRFNSQKLKAKVVDCIKYVNTTEDNLVKLLHAKGPLAVAIDPNGILNYQSGVVERCRSKTITHAVLLVGYGTEKGVPFWILKNCWGEKFGEKGYFRVKRGVNACGLTTLITSVVVP